MQVSIQLTLTFLILASLSDTSATTSPQVEHDYMNLGFVQLNGGFIVSFWL